MPTPSAFSVCNDRLACSKSWMKAVSVTSRSIRPGAIPLFSMIATMLAIV
jgi:hypothetical protein